MRNPFPDILENAMVRTSGTEYDSKPGERFGAFILRRASATVLHTSTDEDVVRIIANDACRESDWWEHVSVSLAHRVPRWEEMCAVKDLFWSEDECVVQFHPARKDYVNFHPYTLHLWRHAKKKFLTPPAGLVRPLRRKP